MSIEDENNSKSSRKTTPNIATDNNKHPISLRRDLLLSNFDKNITVEKARFEPTDEQNENTAAKVVESPNLIMSSSTPTFSTNNNNNNPQPSTSEKRRQAKNENSRKKQKKPIIHGTASPAEVFHRNLVDAVSNVEDSDENEHYVYPYSNTDNNHLTDVQSSSMHRPLSVRSTPSTLFHESRPTRIPTHSNTIGEWLKRTLSRQNHRPPLVEQEEEDADEEEDENYYRRPKLRSTVKDHFTNLDKKGILSRMQDSFSKRNTYPPMQYYADLGGGYTSDDEDAPLLRTRLQKRSKPVKKSYRHVIYHSIWISFLIFACFICAIVYNAKPLEQLNVEIGRVLATDKELIFDLKVRAENRNWWMIHIADVDISVFAFSDIVPLKVQTIDPAEYLGSLTRFDEPLSIPSSLYQRPLKEAISQIRIKSPGADTSGNERWSRIIRYPYGLVVRGVLKYKKVPMYHTQSITICNVTQVNPTTGTLSPDPDKTYCLSLDDSFLFISHAEQDGL
ncbi:hypothetical protein G6F46_004699 [Rhizopus delemar]|uniref:Uncharacterized protein n=2 Tax=Rhizopus TaxID=4842 RepID=A0A9P6YZY8_9FUNG|nr:hypothetical protein G6F43_009062 [Rhizopus delemar]KAG1544167.1 hypothetical protein G6F51_006234 [Rhizopus arrhizus]KAG1455050.1 hypothetical protein G6F55_007290 [Rhizopus delemar]KAG1500010.1 hypothetical protein G6F54_004016 [Rhizopus delemar]KAG1513929.1 hypothetical protein G6F53_004054 [Rhizopus delemar]